MSRSNNMILGAAVAGLAVAAYLAYKSEKEQYMTVGALDHLDSLDQSYQTLDAPESGVPAAHFADVIDNGDQEEEVVGESPMERLDRIQGKSLLPLTAAHLPQYNVDVANPATYSFSVNAPRVMLKNRVNMQADPYRGDVPIRFHPDIPLVGKSSYDRDAWRGDGFFSDHSASLYQKYTGRAYKNMPLKVVNQGIIMDD